ncbi:MAG: hypothetical protein D6723_00890 [Acidobacteria bacterium]|nr:MAG: hypothetical protein D6723_00890 [Acidobacteriota bacterium]
MLTCVNMVKPANKTRIFLINMVNPPQKKFAHISLSQSAVLRTLLLLHQIEMKCNHFFASGVVSRAREMIWAERRCMK